MKNLIKLSFVLCLISFDLYSRNLYTEKTFLQPQPIKFVTDHGIYDYVHMLHNKENRLCNGCLQITSFYRHDINKKNTGTYFGRNNSNVISIGSEKTDFQANNLVFTDTPSELKLRGKLELLPFRKMRGINISYLSRITKNLYFGVSVPWMHITRSMHATVYDEQKTLVEGVNKGILDYFCGDIEQKKTVKQAPLEYAKIRSYGSDYKTGLGDIDGYVSYALFENDARYFRALAGAVFPSSNKPNGKTLFEILTGNGKQWGTFVGIDGMVQVYKSDDRAIKMLYGCNVRKFFSNTQKRMIGFRSHDICNRCAWGHYYGFLGKQGEIGVFPAANILTRDVRVSQGLQYDCFVDCVFAYHNYLFTLGYDYYSRGAESVNVKEWRDGVYALASPYYDTNRQFNIVDNPDPITDDNLEGPIQRNMIDTSYAETPAVITHKIYGMASAHWDNLNIPVHMGVGASLELAQDNAGLEGYELFLNVGVSF